jgi:hypothetical protein
MLIPVPGSLDLLVVTTQPEHLRCRPLGGGKLTTVHPRDGMGLDEVVPGEIITLTGMSRDGTGRSTLLVGDISAVRLDAAALGLVPLRLEEMGDWSPSEEYWGEEGDRLAPCLLPILSAGPRPRFEMEQVVPGADYSKRDGPDPILESVELAARGDRRRAKVVLQKCLAADLRCIDAHAHLGNLAFNRDTARALRHYRVGAAIGELSVPADTTAVLPWGMVDNRPFLRCLHGIAISLWKLRQNAAAVAMMDRILWLCPSDNLGERLVIEAVARGEPWDDQW